MKKSISILLILIMILMSFPFVVFGDDTTDYESMTTLELKEERNRLINQISNRDGAFKAFTSLSGMKNFITSNNLDINMEDYMGELKYNEGGVTYTLQSGPFYDHKFAFNKYPDEFPNGNNCANYPIWGEDTLTWKHYKYGADSPEDYTYTEEELTYLQNLHRLHNAVTEKLKTIDEENNTLINEEIAKIDEILAQRETNKGKITINVDWKDGNPNNKDIPILVVYSRTREPIDDDDDYLVCTPTDSTADSAFSMNPSSKPLNIETTATIPAGATSIDIEVPYYDDVETHYVLYIAESFGNDYYTSLKVTSTSSGASSDAQKLGCVRLREKNNYTYVKNLTLSPKQKGTVTFTNKIVGGDREYTEYLINPEYYLGDAKSIFNVAIATNSGTVEGMGGIYGHKVNSYTLLDTDKNEKADKDWFVAQLKYILQLTVPAHLNPNKMEKTLESICSQIEKHNRWDSFLFLHGYTPAEVKTKVTINKTDLGLNLLEGATLALYKEDTLIEEWSDTTKTFNLTNGTYTIKEINVPAGYEPVEDITFTVNNVTTSTIDIFNKYTNNFFLNDEEDLEKVLKIGNIFTDVLKNSDNIEDYTELTELLEAINNIDFNKNGSTLLRAINTMQPAYILAVDGTWTDEWPGEDVHGTYETIDELKEAIYESTCEALTKQGMEEMIPYLDNSESVYPIIKLADNETIVMNDVVDYLNTAIVLYGRNYEDEGYSVENRTTIINDLYGNIDYTTTYTYTGEEGGRKLIESDSKDAVIDNTTINVVDKDKLFPVKISKKILGGEEVAGATIVVTDEKDNEITTWTSDENGNFEFEVSAGVYFLEETVAPEGLQRITTKIKFEVTKEGEVKLLEANVSEEEGKITVLDKNHLVLEDAISPKEVEISKQDMTTGEELPGATLKVIDTNGDVVKEWVSTTESYKITLMPGTYTLREETAPEGYLTAEEITFEVDRFGLVGSDKVVMKDEKIPDNTTIMKVSVHKYDAEKKIPLKNAEITIFTDKDEVVKDINGKECIGRTDENGIVTFEISKNDYPNIYALETEAPEGYQINSDKFPVKCESEEKEVSIDIDIYDYEIPNTGTPNVDLTVSVYKVSANDKKLPLKDAEITLFNEDGTVAKDINNKDCIGMTDEKGNITFKVSCEADKKFYVQETKAPSGYHINQNKFELVAKADAENKCEVNIEIEDTLLVLPPDAQSNTPKTGDNTNIMLFVGLFAGALILTSLLAIKTHKK